MKKITLLLAFLISSIGFSQDLLLGFETAESGGLNGGPFGNASALQVNLVNGTGTNTTQVAEFIANSGGEVWQGINLNLTENVDLSSTQTMTIDVKSATAITFLVKVNGGISGAPEAAAEVTHNGDGNWQTLSFTFNSVKDGKAAAAAGQYASFVIHAYWAPGVAAFGDVTKDERTFYVDNIKGPKAGAPAADIEPTDAPATPPSFDSNNVISIYSDAYTSSAANFANVTWDDSEFEEVTIAGNKVLKIKGTNFIGIDLGTYLDATSMTHLHMDYWIGTDFSPGQVMNPKLSNHAAQNGETSAIDISNPINSQSEVKNWQSKDFELSGDREAIKEFLITQAGKSGLYYLDNVYFYVNGTASTTNNKVLGFGMFPNPANNELTISAKETISKAEVFNVLGRKVKTFAVNNSKKSLDISELSSGVYLIKYESAGKVGTAKFVKQ